MTETEAPSQIPIGYTALQGSPIQSTPLQNGMSPHLGGIATFYWILWTGTLLFLIAKYVAAPFLKRK